MVSQNVCTDTERRVLIYNFLSIMYLKKIFLRGKCHHSCIMSHVSHITSHVLMKWKTYKKETKNVKSKILLLNGIICDNNLQVNMKSIFNLFLNLKQTMSTTRIIIYENGYISQLTFHMKWLTSNISQLTSHDSCFCLVNLQKNYCNFWTV